jgi:hypothetical protein
VSPEAGLVVLAAIFAAGIVLFALLMISLLPGAFVLESRLLPALRRRRRGTAEQPPPGPPAQAGDT